MAATMAATSCIAAAPSHSAFLSGQSLQGKPTSSLAISRRAPSAIVVRASSEEAQPSRNSVVLSAVLGAAAALAVGFGGDALAASGPGVPGAERTAEKADELLKAADALTANESPPRFGPGRVGGDESDKLAQKAGSGANDTLQGAQQTFESGVGAAKDAVESGPSDVGSKAASAGSDIASKASNVADKASNVADTKGNWFSSLFKGFGK